MEALQSGGTAQRQQSGAVAVRQQRHGQDSRQVGIEPEHPGSARLNGKAGEPVGGQDQQHQPQQFQIVIRQHRVNGIQPVGEDQPGQQQHRHRQQDLGFRIRRFAADGHACQQADPGDSDNNDPTQDPSGDPECPTVQFDELLKTNGDVIAWIYGANTHINYPVVQGSDNDYYLRHLLDGTWNDNGSIFMDCANSADFSDQNSLIYGHNMTSGAMFSNLVKYKQQAYYDQHPYLYMLTPQQSYKLHLFAGVIVDASGYILDGNGQVAYSDCSVYQFQLTQEFLQQMVNHSTFRPTTGVPSADSHIVTLSTCTYEFKNVRYVVLGVLEPIQ